MAIYHQMKRIDMDIAKQLIEQGTIPKSATPTYSLAEIVFNDGAKYEFMVSAGPTVVPHLVKEMKSTGYLTLWNDTDTFCVRADVIKHFALREITSK
jgi:hypothetical protein